MAKRAGWFLYDVLGLIGQMLVAVGFVLFIAGVCVIGPPFPPEPGDRLLLIGVALAGVAAAALVMWVGFKLADRDGPRYWLWFRLTHGNTVSIRAVFGVTRAVHKAGIIGWDSRDVAQCLVRFVTGEQTEPFTNGEEATWNAYRHHAGIA